ncbi:periplasmic binding protein-like I [Chytriomyces sp. MP71]|nr:periplasmic binding protein-like I [Chytriomyces sp. MP71]
MKGHALLLLIYALAALASQDPLQFKNQSSITFAIVGPYGWIHGFNYNGTQVREGNETVDVARLSNINNWNYDQWWFWNQQAVVLAIEQINRDAHILPNTTIKIKRFNTVPNKNAKMGAYDALGSRLAEEIPTKHSDVVAVIGEFFSETTVNSNEIYSHYQIPFCGGMQGDTRLWNRHNYPYNFQTLPFTSFMNPFQIILKTWNVTQVAFLSAGRLSQPYTLESNIIFSLRQKGIFVAANFQIGAVSAKFMADTIEASNIRYIIMYATPDIGAKMFYNFAHKLKRLVGPEYVWITVNPLIPNLNATAEWGPKYFEASKGVIWVNVEDPILASPYTAELYAKYTNVLQSYQKKWGPVFDESTFINDFNVPGMIDCAYLMAIGIQQLLQRHDIGVDQLRSEAVKPLLNWTLFQNTGYRGLSADPLILTSHGDCLSSAAIYYFDGTGDSTGVAFGYTNLDMTKILYFNGSRPKFFDGSSIPPSDGAGFITTMRFSSPQVAFLWFFCGAGILVFSAFVALVGFCWKEEAVRSGSPRFLVILAIGGLLSFVGNILYIVPPSISFCQARVWLQLTSYSIMVGAAVTKNWRLQRVFNAKVKLKRGARLEWIWLGILFAIVLLEQLLLILWVRFTKLRVITKLVSATQTYQACVAQSNNWEYAFWVYNGLLWLGLIQVTYTTKNVGPTHSEFSILLLSSVLITLGAILLPSRDELEANINAAFLQAVIVWVGTIVPISMQMAQRGLGIYQEVFGGTANNVYNDIKEAWRPSEQATTKRQTSLHPTSRNPSQVQRTSIDRTKEINLAFGIVTYDVACQLHQTYWYHRWQRGVVAVMSVGANKYIQFLPRRRDVASPSVAYIFSPQRTAVQLVELNENTLEVKVKAGKLILEFLDQNMSVAFAEKVAEVTNLTFLKGKNGG